MKRARLTEEQIIAVLKEHEAGTTTADLARKYGISEVTNRATRSLGKSMSNMHKVIARGGRTILVTDRKGASLALAAF